MKIEHNVQKSNRYDTHSTLKATYIALSAIRHKLGYTSEALNFTSLLRSQRGYFIFVFSDYNLLTLLPQSSATCPEKTQHARLEREVLEFLPIS